MGFTGGGVTGCSGLEAGDRNEMQRSVEQRQAPKRRIGERRAPSRAVLRLHRRGNGLSSIVLVGNWLFAAAFFALAKFFWHWVPTDWTLGDRIALVIKDAVIAILPAVLAICIVAAQRLDPQHVGRPHGQAQLGRSTSTPVSSSTRSSSSSPISSAMRAWRSIARPRRRAP